MTLSFNNTQCTDLGTGGPCSQTEVTLAEVTSALLCLSHIDKAFGDNLVLKDVSLHVCEGEIVSLLGVSGAGKTTLFNIAAGLLMPDKGDVLLRGTRINGQSGHVAYMLQKDMLLPHLRIIDNVTLPLRIKGVSKRDAREKAAPLFEPFGLAGTEYSYPGELSGGMAQRAAFLRTYLFSKDMALLDEPFSALDAITKEQIHDWYLEMKEKIGLSTLLITHDIDEALELSDRIYIMGSDPGRIIAEFKLPDKKSGGHFWLSPQFIDYKKQILGLLSRSETAESQGNE